MTGFVISAIVTVAGLGAIYYDNNRLTTSRYNIVSKKLPVSFKGYRILQLSDLHSKVFGKNNERLMKLINKENPNIIVMTGDMVNSRDNDFTAFLNLANDLAASYEVYFIEGNNETSLIDKDRELLLRKLNKSSVKILKNQKATISRGNDKINLFGLWFDIKYYKKINSGYTKGTYFKEQDMSAALGVCPQKEFNILLAHNPLYFDSYAKWGADLTIAGHIHGGLIRLPGKRGLLSPERKFFPKYSEGEYMIDNNRLIVNRGLGSKMVLPRIFNCPEVSIIELKNVVLQ